MTLFLTTPIPVRLFLMKYEDIREEIPEKQQLMMRAKQELLQRLPSAKDLVDVQYIDYILFFYNFNKCFEFKMNSRILLEYLRSLITNDNAAISIACYHDNNNGHHKNQGNWSTVNDSTKFSRVWLPWPIFT